jgi:DNA polymerase-3 subunit gamma/tau
MSYLVLARKYRPQTFDELVAQKHITETLKNAIKTDHIAQAFLFTGPRGVGKTSMARILAKALNCKEGPTITPCNKCKNCLEITNSTSADVIEIDGASNTGVEDVRGLQNELMYPPQSSKFKIYIIDEVHMLSKNAFNALLKTLEEPPKNVKFIFATTEPHKVIPTITSRCQRYDFHRIPIQEIINQIKKITPYEQIDFEDSAIFLIAKKADGSLRDALSLMDQILSLGKNKITKDDVLQVFGIVDIDFFHTLVKNIIENNDKKVIDNFHNIVAEGNDVNELTLGFIEYLRNILMLKIGIKPEEVHPDDAPKLTEFGENFSEENLLYAISILADTKEKLKTSSHPILLLETTLLKFTHLKNLITIENITKTLSKQQKTASRLMRPPKVSYEPKVATERKLFIREEKPREKKPEDKSEKSLEKPITQPSETIEKIEITEELLAKEWHSIEEKMKEEMPISAIHLSKIQLKSIKNNFLHYTTTSKLVYQTLTDVSEHFSRLLTQHFGTPIKIDFELLKSEEKRYINNPTITDIKRESPKLAELIEAVDGFILGQKRE